MDDFYDTLSELQLFIKNREKKRILELEQRIHVRILEATGSQLIIETGRTILERIWMLQKVILFTSEHWDESQRQHLEIVKSLAEGNPEKSADLVKKHLTWGKELVVRRLHDEGDFMANIFTGTSEIYQIYRKQAEELASG